MTNKEKSFFAVVRQSDGHTWSPLWAVKNARRIINAKINLQTQQLTGAGPARRLCFINRSTGVTAMRGRLGKMWAHH